MAISVVLNGVTYCIPSPGGAAWATTLNSYLVALATNAASPISLGPVVSSPATPNVNGATLTGSVLKLALASTSYPGLLSAGDKTAIDLLGVLPVAGVQTTGATPEDVYLGLDMVGSLKNCATLELVVTAAVNGGGNSAGYGRVGTFKNVASTVTAVGSATSLWTHESDAAWDCAFVITANLVYARVTGAAATIIDWTFRSRILSSV